MSAILKILILFSPLVCGSCVRHRIEFVSVPSEATLSEVTADGKSQILGKTPMIIDDRVNLERRSFLLEAPGHVSQDIRIIFPYTADAKITSYLTPLDDSWYKEVLLKNYPEKVDTLVRDMLKFQQFLSKSDLNGAEKRIESYSQDFGDISIFHTLVGLFYYKHRSIGKSQASLKNALILNPKNEVAKKILKVIATDE